MHRKGPHFKVRPPRKALGGAPFAKGVVLKTLIKKPKKPNSANRKCVLVRLSTGKEMVAYIPGIGHNLQEHNIVLVRCGRLRDVPGVKLKCVRGVHDLPHVIRKAHHVKKWFRSRRLECRACRCRLVCRGKINLNCLGWTKLRVFVLRKYSRKTWIVEVEWRP